MIEMIKTTIVWFKKDLRLKDNSALIQAIASGHQVLPLFILDDQLKPLGAAQEWWLYHSLQSLDKDLRALGLRLILRRGPAEDVIRQLATGLNIDQIHWARAYTPDAIRQEQRVQTCCRDLGINSVVHKGSVLFEPHEIQTLKAGTFSVYTPFWNALQKQRIEKALPAPTQMPACPPVESDVLEDWNLTKPWSHKLNGLWQVGEQAAQDKLDAFLEGPIEQYDVMRDYPGVQGTSSLSPHLHFGEISPRDIWNQVILKREMSPVSDGYTTYLKEIVWREFSYHLLFHNPRILKENFRTDFDGFPWGQNEAHLRAWQKGLTGYPLVDAGMRQLWATGTMHNRVRMIVASFLTKNLMIDWRAGEEWFWNTLLDADQASNAANWQWVAGCGADAAPYFRVFNPLLQSVKFDAKGDYIRQWVPELARLSHKNIHAPFELDPWVLAQSGVKLGDTYPNPIVDLKATRDRALATYKAWVGKEVC